MKTQFLFPWFGLLFIALPFVWWSTQEHIRKAHVFLRLLIIGFITLTLMRPVFYFSDSMEYHVIVLDSSDSVVPSSLDRAIEEVNRIVSQREEHQVYRVVQIGGELPLIKDVETSLLNSSLGQSSLSSALSQALLLIPKDVGGSVSLFTDGMATDGHFSQQLAQLKEREISVHRFQLNGKRSEAYIAEVALSHVRFGDVASAKIMSISDSKPYLIRLTSDDKVVASAQINAIGEKDTRLSFEPTKTGFLPLIAEMIDVTSGKTVSQVKTILAVQEPTKVLHISGRFLNSEQKLAEALGSAYKVDTYNVSQVSDLLDVRYYNLVVLDDVPVNQLPSKFTTELKKAVADDGLGLFTTGVESFYGSGGYFETDLASVLPVELQQKTQKKDPSVGLAIIIDTSGSMAGTRIELARQIARIAARKLKPRDYVGIVEFYGAKHWAIPMQHAANKIEIDRAIARMKAVGGTVLYPAIQEAYYGLKNLNTRYKHILMITDAGVEDAGYEQLVRSVAKDKINLSTVLVGQGGHNQVMSDIANWGKGRFYSVGNEFQLVEMLLKQPSMDDSDAFESGTFNVTKAVNSSFLANFALNDIPSVKKYAKVNLRSNSNLILKVGPNDAPLLASWQYGLGKVTSLMTEPFGEGTELWQSWHDYGNFVSAIADFTSNRLKDFDIQIHRNGYNVTITAHRLSNGINAPKFKKVNDLADNGNPIEFEQKSPDIYVSRQVMSPTQDVLIESLNGYQRFALRASSDISPELEVSSLDQLNLSEFFRELEGDVINGNDGSWLPNITSKRSITKLIPLWPYLILMALLIYISELIYRRLPRSSF